MRYYYVIGAEVAYELAFKFQDPQTYL